MKNRHDPESTMPTALWQELHSATNEAARTIFSDHNVKTPLVKAEATRYLLRICQFAREALVENHNPAYPMLSKCESPFLQWGYPNPDYVYWYAPVHGDHTYRLYGRRGTSRMFTVETWSGDWHRIGDQKILECKVHVNDGSGELAIDPEGNFEITLSRAPQAGNWLPIGEGLGTILIRNCYYDWETETPTQLYMERAGATYPAPPVTAAELEDNIERLCEFLRDAPSRLQKGAGLHYLGLPNTIRFPELDNALGTNTGFPKQFYGRGHYQCEPNEAIIIEVKPPVCAFWGFQLGSPFWEAWDWHFRSMSINGHQAVLDHDGIFRAVIAHRDPGVSNWLDVAGHSEGTLGCRWNRPLDQTSAVVPKLRKVSFESLRHELPPETAMSNPQERSDILRRRMLSVRRRGAD